MSSKLPQDTRVAVQFATNLILGFHGHFPPHDTENKVIEQLITPLFRGIASRLNVTFDALRTEMLPYLLIAPDPDCLSIVNKSFLEPGDQRLVGLTPRECKFLKLLQFATVICDQTTLYVATDVITANTEHHSVRYMASTLTTTIANVLYGLAGEIINTRRSGGGAGGHRIRNMMTIDLVFTSKTITLAGILACDHILTCMLMRTLGIPVGSDSITAAADHVTEVMIAGDQIMLKQPGISVMKSICINTQWWDECREDTVLASLKARQSSESLIQGVEQALANTVVPDDFGSIFLVGTTGSGKSTMVNCLLDRVAARVSSCGTGTVRPMRYQKEYRVNGQTRMIYLHDTPGLNDAVIPDAEVLRRIERYTATEQYATMILFVVMNGSRTPNSETIAAENYIRIFGDSVKNLFRVVIGTERGRHGDDVIAQQKRVWSEWLSNLGCANPRVYNITPRYWTGFWGVGCPDLGSEDELARLVHDSLQLKPIMTGRRANICRMIVQLACAVSVEVKRDTKRTLIAAGHLDFRSILDATACASSVKVDYDTSGGIFNVRMNQKFIKRFFGLFRNPVLSGNGPRDYRFIIPTCLQTEIQSLMSEVNARILMKNFTSTLVMHECVILETQNQIKRRGALTVNITTYLVFDVNQRISEIMMTTVKSILDGVC